MRVESEWILNVVKKHHDGIRINIASHKSLHQLWSECGKFQLIILSMQPHIASLAYGMYEILYQVMAQNWITTNINANTFFFHQNAEQSVRKNATNMMIVASTLVLANMFFSCFIGPIRNIVLPSDMKFPTVYKTANAFSPPPRGNIVRMTEPRMEHNTPTPKQIQKPLILVFQDKVDASRAWATNPVSSSSCSLPDKAFLSLSMFDN